MEQVDWINDAIFYHIFPLGFCGADHTNDGTMTPEPKIFSIIPWLDRLVDLGVNAILFGPVFESSSHGYDTADYFWLDRRLGTNNDFKQVADEIHRRGIRIVLDGVFNHVGRRFWAFRDLLANGEGSIYKDWFVDVRFNERSPYGDPFRYSCWEGHYNLPKLNLANPAVSRHLLDAVEFWIREFGIDGLRLDAADCVDPLFWKELHQHTKKKRPDFWLMGEIIHGDYRRWANAEQFDSVTNYEAYKGIWSSLNDHNYWEIAFTLNRQFGESGIYRNLGLYTFVDNHDVSRIATILKEPAHLYLAYCVMLTMPGVPSIYYGSELGWRAAKQEGDWNLRPVLNPEREKIGDQASEALRSQIKQLVELHKNHSALREGDYHQVHVSNEQFGFLRWNSEEKILMLFNAANNEACLNLSLPSFCHGQMTDAISGVTLGHTADISQIIMTANSCRIIAIFA